MKVFYDDRQSVKANSSFSPSAEKPAKVLESWLKLGIPFDVCSFEPLTVDEIALAHDRFYVDGVLSLEAPNGFGNMNPEVAGALPWVCGSMVAAALHAYNTGELSFSPTSGAHHACYAHGMCYCTFNFLVMAAIKVHQAGASWIGILDLDCHHGNGTINIIDRLGLDYIQHYSFGDEHLGFGRAAEEWVIRLPDIVSSFKGADLLIFNAGVDPHIEDPLGGMLTTRQMTLRDRLVFKVAKQLNLKVCVSLAGGYQVDAEGNIDKLLALHDTTFKAGWSAFEMIP
jgi:acetoin utilization deacetylase AcuC-like enzyme